eukprot:10132634-Ditylum_brightwellii.AAC.1
MDIAYTGTDHMRTAWVVFDRSATSTLFYPESYFSRSQFYISEVVVAALSSSILVAAYSGSSRSMTYGGGY